MWLAKIVTKGNVDAVFDSASYMFLFQTEQCLFINSFPGINHNVENNTCLQTQFRVWILVASKAAVYLDLLGFILFL